MDTDVRTAELLNSTRADLDPFPKIPNASAAYWRMRCQDTEQRLDALEDAYRRTFGDRAFRRVIIGTALVLIGYLGGVLAA